MSVGYELLPYIYKGGREYVNRYVLGCVTNLINDLNYIEKGKCNSCDDKTCHNYCVNYS